jgi:hypothetical protein
MALFMALLLLLLLLVLLAAEGSSAPRRPRRDRTTTGGSGGGARVGVAVAGALRPARALRTALAAPPSILSRRRRCC